MKIEFIGKFKDLIPMGYTFHKLFARNYKVYSKDNIWIWVSGKEVSIKDLGLKNSYDIAKLIIENKYPVYEKEKNYHDIVFFEKGEPRDTILDNKTGKVIERHEFMKARNYNHNYDHKRYRELILNTDIFETINELYKKGMIVL